MMGSRSDEKGRYHDELQHLVTLTSGFYIQTTPLTQKQWRQVMEDNPSLIPQAHQKAHIRWLEVGLGTSMLKVVDQHAGTFTHQVVPNFS